MANIGRNDPCPCGSGKKYKKCCINSTRRVLSGQTANMRTLKMEDDIIQIGEVIDYGIPILDDTFFETNNVHKISAARLLYSFMIYHHAEGVINRVARQFIDRGKDELNRIKKSKDIETLVEIMKGNPDPINHEPLMEKLANKKTQVLPVILRELKEPQNDSFVELAVRILYRIGVNCSGEIIDIINSGNNRKAYAISTLCVLLGFYDNAHSEKVLWDYYHYMKYKYPNEIYSDGPLLGLIEMRERKRETNEKTQALHLL